MEEQMPYAYDAVPAANVVPLLEELIVALARVAAA
jgi:hypothetical protein